MRKLLTLTLASISVITVAACSKTSPVATMSADLKRDLKLASTTQDIRINPDEITPAAKPEAAPKAKKAPSGPKVVRSQKPTALASATPVEQAEIPEEVPDVQMTAPAPAPAVETAPAAPPLARPSTIPASNAGSGRADNGSGSGSVWGGIFGAVIRGGVVGDDDHCDPRTMPRGGRRPTSSDIGGIYGGGMGGMGGMRGIPPIAGRRR